MRATVLTRDPAAFARKAPHLAQRSDLHFHPGDLRTFAFPERQYDHLIHAAADTGVWMEKKNFDGVIDVVVAGTRHLLDFAAQAGVKNFLLISSGAVYGPQPAGLVQMPEDYPGAPDSHAPESAWGAGKRVAEELCTEHSARHGYAVKIARGFAFLGPHLPLDANYAMGNFLRDAMRGEPIRVNGDGTPVRSYLYAADLAIWLWTILFRGAPARAYNVGSDVAASLAEHARIVSTVFGGKSPVLIARPPGAGPGGGRYVPAISRAGAELGLALHITEAEGIRRTRDWLGTPAGNISSP
jgi:dTDP-glucose 4,6-dehydratase